MKLSQSPPTLLHVCETSSSHASRHTVRELDLAFCKWSCTCSL